MSEIEELRAENAELKVANERLMDTNGYLCEKLNELADERVRLRTLGYKLIAVVRVVEQDAPGTVFCPEYYYELAEGAGLEVPR